MNLQEHIAKELLSQYGIPCPKGRLAKTASSAEDSCALIQAKKYVVKAQIAAGGRGLAGGVRFAATPSAVHDEAERMLNSRLVTDQTRAEGEVVHTVYVEAAHDLSAQYFVAFVLDAATGFPMLLASANGGIAFEERARMDPDAVAAHVLDEQSDIDGFLKTVGIEDGGAVDAVKAAARAFEENDMVLLEINPFAKTANGDWLAIDAKIALDPAAAFRHPEFDRLYSNAGQSAQESEAQQNNINFVRLDGDIGVVVNGAGLGLATNDLIVDAGGEPANFMDIRTTATSFDIARGVELLLADPGVKALLLNVHGGGMTVCDTVAEGVAFAYSRNNRNVPCIARLAGTNADWGERILMDRKVPVDVCNDMKTAVQRAVSRVGEA